MSADLRRSFKQKAKQAFELPSRCVCFFKLPFSFVDGLVSDYMLLLFFFLLREVGSIM